MMDNFNAISPKNENNDNDNLLLKKRKGIPDYDEQPYGKDNIMVRSMKRRAFLVSTAEL